MTTRLGLPHLIACALLAGAVPAASAAPTLLADIRTGTDATFLSGRNHAVIGNTVYLSAEAQGLGREPWVSDGTAEGTVLLEDLRPGNPNSDPGGFTALGDSVLFLAFDERGLGLWKTGGTTGSTVRLRASTNIIFPTARNMARVGSSVFFGAELDDTGEELWKSDGTPEGTVRVADLREGAQGSRPSRLTPAGNLLFFTATPGPTSRSSLWRSDGTAAGTVKLWEPSTGTASFSFLASTGSTLLMGVQLGSSSELWKSDGTPGGTTRVAALGTFGLGSYAFLNGQLVFRHGNGLGKSDGTSAGTSI
ncbi:hypothetical protein JY651_48885 [Pyxidicoccus parkwayensis]|uniref:Hyalin repeat protein n=1 Tax=Pyxidicoccus parkwayensis TaxID=2813578 RepID=A0ABX7NX22_9BACT|nr:hypothetical protein [Pyxidicoccus parkwaysis]QSQ22929.1 hypothetical protein JY651_48885 [Pyxidicoccus parkwaysis]